MSTSHSHQHGGAFVAAAVAALTGGVLSSLQSRANGELSQVLGAPVIASLWSFGSGLVVLSVALAHPSARAGLRRVAHAVRSQHLQWWELVGGLFGGFFVAVQTSVVPVIGVAMFTVALVGGQTGNALLVDRLGLGPAGRSPVTMTRAAAALLTFLGVALAATARGGSAGSTTLLPVMLAVLAGAGMAVQGAINGKVNRQAAQPMATTWVNFVWGTGFLAGLAVVELATHHLRLTPPSAVPWWALVGGLIGVVYIAVNAVVVARLGVLVMTLMILTGQLMAAVALDVLFPTNSTRLSGQLIAGVAVTLAASAWAAWSARPRTQARVGTPVVTAGNRP